MKIVFEEYFDKMIKIICTDNLKRYCFLIFISTIIDYKELVLITKIKTNG